MAKDQVKLAICMTRQHQILTAVLSHAAANNMKYPEHITTLGAGPGQKRWWGELNAMTNALGTNYTSSGYISEIYKGCLDSIDIWFCPLSVIKTDTLKTGQDVVQRTYAQIYENADIVNYPWV